MKASGLFGKKLIVTLISIIYLTESCFMFVVEEEIETKKLNISDTKTAYFPVNGTENDEEEEELIESDGNTTENLVDDYFNQNSQNITDFVLNKTDVNYTISKEDEEEFQRSLSDDYTVPKSKVIEEDEEEEKEEIDIDKLKKEIGLKPKKVKYYNRTEFRELILKTLNKDGEEGGEYFEKIADKIILKAPEVVTGDQVEKFLDSDYLQKVFMEVDSSDEPDSKLDEKVFNNSTEITLVENNENSEDLDDEKLTEEIKRNIELQIEQLEKESQTIPPSNKENGEVKSNGVKDDL